jgi:hypothetical protein
MSPLDRPGPPVSSGTWPRIRSAADAARLEHLKTDLPLCRPIFGQPRREDILERVRRRGVEATTEDIQNVRIDPRRAPGKRPPPAATPQPSTS